MAEAAKHEVTAPGRFNAKLLVTVLFVVTAAASLGLAVSLWPAASFALLPAAPRDLGAAEAGAIEAGFVRVQVAYTGSPRGEFRRPLDRSDHVVSLAKVPASHPPTAVLYRVPPDLKGPRFVPPRLVQGHAMKAEDVGWRYRGLGELLGPAKSGWVVIDGETPASQKWLLGVEALLLALSVGAGLALWRIHRPVT